MAAAFVLPLFALDASAVVVLVSAAGLMLVGDAVVVEDEDEDV